MKNFAVYFNGGSDGLITVTTDALGYKHVEISPNSGNKVGKYSAVEVPKGVGTLNVSTYYSWESPGIENWQEKNLTVYFCDRAYWLLGSQTITADTDVDVSAYAGAELMIFYEQRTAGLSQVLLIKGSGVFTYKEWVFDDNDELTLETLPEETNQWEPPYPPWLWGFDEAEELSAEIMPVVAGQWESPYPLYLWRFVRGELEHPLLPGYVDPQGAFKYASDLIKVRIPDSVKQIGEEAFRYTALKRVSIADDCICYSTSFPENCIVQRRSTVPCGQLYDKDGKAVLDCDAVRVYVKNTESEEE